MRIVSKEEFFAEKDFFIGEMRVGKIFVYPTDTIYGIGCNSNEGKSVTKIREIKRRDEKPFSVIVPSKEWVKEHCYVDSLTEEWLKKLPGPYTLILELRNWNDAVANEVNEGGDTLGVRIPNHWFSEVVGEANIGFVTTSVNVSGEPNIKDVKEISSEMAENIDYVIDDGVLEGGASRVVSLINGFEKIIR
ncbi:MAG: threonylcarbamoyl-AMP synthase [Nanoarchaeota archaeon]|nr:threonylcarbamoyl-AMP synthase [Nanoarchaeota archaeon]